MRLAGPVLQAGRYIGYTEIYGQGPGLARRQAAAAHRPRRARERQIAQRLPRPARRSRRGTRLRAGEERGSTDGTAQAGPSLRRVAHRRLDGRDPRRPGRALSEVVLDASVVLKWFHAEGERHLKAARSLRTRFEAGELRVLAPPLLWLELLNVAARRWGWTQDQLIQLAAALPNLGFDLIEPDLTEIARWTAQGLTAYDAAYVAVADQTGIELITDDTGIVAAAAKIAIPLGDR